MNSKVGRKRLYDNEKTMRILEELLINYRKENPTGQVTFIKMAEYSNEMHNKYNERYPIAYNRFVWAKQGRHLIEKVNTPIRNYSKFDSTNFEIPPIARYIEEYSSNPKKLLSLLLPVEKMIYNLLESDENNSQQIQNLNTQVDKLKNEMNKLILLNDNLSQYLLSIVAQSNVKRLRQNYGLPEILEFNESAVKGLNDLKKFLYPDNDKTLSTSKQVSQNEPTLLAHWGQVKGTKNKS
ncbi:hypothetical protein [Paenibacillus endoradicis]|uniref:hypothetical protein n=1 Tax=Paenibacillus endoradicis TaxID=2972487 RepID=UPI00215969A3|nr:hypothetical protein [Paenibacillus endoradicis]MCR8659172.1 hypothetical protein [Paenibacillus endoradicis]